MIYDANKKGWSSKAMYEVCYGFQTQKQANW